MLHAYLAMSYSTNDTNIQQTDALTLSVGSSDL